MQNLVSVIMPVYQVHRIYLKRSIESIISQTYDNLEFIVVIDPSTSKKRREDVIATVDEYRDDKRIRVILNKVRKGFTRSLNSGIVSSKGEYIARMDSDDISANERLEKQLKFLKNSRAHIAGTWARIIDHEGKKIGVAKPPTDSETIKRLIMLHNPIIHGSVMMEKGVFRNIALYSPYFRANEDYEVWLRAINSGYLISNVPDFLFYLRENPASITRGSEWLANRLNYLRCKVFALIKYNYRSIRDVAYCLGSIMALFTYPKASPIKSLISNMQKRISQKYLKS